MSAIVMIWCYSQSRANSFYDKHSPHIFSVLLHNSRSSCAYLCEQKNDEVEIESALHHVKHLEISGIGKHGIFEPDILHREPNVFAY